MSEICIIVPVYNRKDTIRRCVSSIVSQTFSDWTLLLVDDGSSDDSGKICEEYASADHRIRVLHKANGGVSSARNSGLDWAFAHDSSYWLAFLDSDDWILPSYFQQLLHAAKYHNVLVSCCDYVRVTDPASFLQMQIKAEDAIMLPTEEYWYRYPSPSVVPWGKIYKKELFRSVRYPLGKVCDDTFTTHRVLFQCDQVAWTNQKLYCYYISQDGISRERSSRLLEQWSEAYEAQAAFFHDRKLLRIRGEAVRRMIEHKHQAIRCAEYAHDHQAAGVLIKDLNRQILWARKDLDIRLSGNEYIYESAMPLQAALSRKWRHFKKWLRKLVKR